MKKTNQHFPELILGTAMWGWNTSRENAFALLDEWYASGFRQVDTATNYPIDKNPDHFRLAENILAEWIHAHGVADLELMVKIGSVNNLFTPEHILTESFILMMLDEYAHLFKNNLRTIMIHWDNREEEDDIRETITALKKVNNKGWSVGLSGIKRPDIYFKLNKKYNLDFLIQIKHNVLYSDYQRYRAFHGQRRFITYGINAGGLKLNKGKYTSDSTLKTRGGDPEKEPPVLQKIKAILADFEFGDHRPPVTAFYQIGLIHAFYQKEVAGILLGAAKKTQLQQNISFYRLLQKMDYADLGDLVSSVAV